MKFNKAILLLVLLIFSFTSVTAQLKESYKPKANQRTVDDPVAGDWSFGVGFNIVDDGGVKFGGLFGGNKYLHFHMPLTINAEYFYNSKFSFTATFSMNKYVEGKNIDDLGTIIKDEEASYTAFDLGTKFYLRDIINDYIFEPYVFSGVGFTKIGAYKLTPNENEAPDYLEIDENGNYNIPAIGRMTFNGGLGANFWFTKTWGANINGAFKLGIGNSKHQRGPNSISNQIQLSFGTFYCLKK